MIIEIDTHSGVPIYTQIIEQVRRLIVAGHLAEGEQIEQVRILAERLKVNPMTISKAYGILERDGMLERRRGIGLFVARLRKDTQERFRDGMVADACRKAAAAAIQMGLGEDEAVSLIRQSYQNIISKKKG